MKSPFLDDVEQNRCVLPPSLEEAKLRFQLTASDYSWASLIQARPFLTTGLAMLTGLGLGWSSTMRKNFRKAFSTGFKSWMKKD